MKGVPTAVLAAGLLLTVSETAFAQTADADAWALPVALAERPLTLPKGTLRLDTELIFQHFTYTALVEPFPDATQRVTSETLAWLTGAGFGVTDDFELGALVLPLQVSPAVDLGHVMFYGMYRFYAGESVEIGLRAELRRVPTDRSFGVALGLPVLYRVGRRFRIDTGLQIGTARGGSSRVGLYSDYPHPSPTRSQTGVPLVVNLNITDTIFVGGRTGFAVENLRSFADTIAVPLGAQAGYTLAFKGLVADLALVFELPGFVTTMIDDPIYTDLWRIRLSINVFLDMI